MKKCDVFTTCACDEHLVMKLDLRVELENRIAEVARAVVPLKERIDGLQVSASLVYQENGMTKFCSFPVCIAENEQERILKLLFPVGQSVTIWMDGAEKVISGLEYHVDKHTESVTEVMSDLSTFQPVPGRIQFSFHVGDVTEEGSLNSDTILSSIAAQAKEVRDWNLPIDLLLVDVPGKRFWTAGMIEIQRSFSVSGVTLKIRARRPNIYIPKIAREVIELVIDVTREGIEVEFIEKTAVLPNLIFLYEDSDGVISSADHDDGGSYVGNWNWFGSELEVNQHPVVYLCSRESGSYCPVFYQVSRNEDGSVSGFSMEISYYREVDGQLELWTEQRIFSGLPGSGATYANPAASGPKIRKVSLGAITY